MTASPPVQKMLGPYRIEGLIGRGGMGEVYRAFDTRRGRQVALKVLAAEYARDAHYRARFRRESDSAARLQDPHVVPIHDFGEIEGHLFIDMRLVDGTGLDDVLRSGPLDVERAVRIVEQVGEALTAAHEMGIVHRDVKPSNILVTRSGFAYLADFGIARSLGEAQTQLTDTGRAVGTLAYMAPERFEGGQPDRRSDVYALACVLAECLIGHPPFDATSFPAVMRSHLVAPPPRPSTLRPGLPAAIDAVVARGMEKDPDQRWQSTHELGAAARRAAQGEEVAAARAVRPAGGADRPRPARSRRPMLLVGAALALVLVALVGGYAVGVAAGSGGGAGSGSPTGGTTASARPAQAANVPTRRSSRYTYSVSGSYGADIDFTDENGDSVSMLLPSLPWTKTVSTQSWGPDANAAIRVQSTSPKGDTTVSCTIRDTDGRVVKTDTKSAAYATALCNVLG